MVFNLPMCIMVVPAHILNQGREAWECSSVGGVLVWHVQRPGFSLHRHIEQGMGLHACNPRTGRWRQRDQRLKIIFHYIGNVWLTFVIWDPFPPKRLSIYKIKRELPQIGAREMALWVKYLLHKHEDLNSNLQNLQKPSMVTRIFDPGVPTATWLAEAGEL